MLRWMISLTTHESSEPRMSMSPPVSTLPVTVALPLHSTLPAEPAHEEQAWVECVAYALQSGTDLMNNIYEIDYGGHSEEWVEHGQFNWRQEGALSQLVEPGEQCRSFVRRGIDSSMVSSIERYLQLSEALGEVCQEQ